MQALPGLPGGPLFWATTEALWGKGKGSLPAPLENSSFVVDGEAVLLGIDGRSDFNGLHSRKHDDAVQF